MVVIHRNSLDLRIWLECASFWHFVLDSTRFVAVNYSRLNPSNTGANAGFLLFECYLTQVKSSVLPLKQTLQT